VLDDVPEGVEIALDQRVDQIEVGDLVEVELDDRARPARGRPTDLGGEELEQEAEEEDREGVDDDPVEATADVPRSVAISPG
jgi:hypothetical protein